MTKKMRKPQLDPRPASPSGHVGHDHKGNATWHWSSDGDTPSERIRRLGLAVTADERAVNSTGIKMVSAEFGFDPYDSGLVIKSERASKRGPRRQEPPSGAHRLRGKNTKF